MKYRNPYVFLIVLTISSLICLLVLQPVIAQAPAKPDLEITYSERGLEVIEIKMTDQSTNPDGSVSANISLVSKSAITYGLAFAVETGSVTSDWLLKFAGKKVSIPFVGTRPLNIGRVTFSPGAKIKIKLNKWGVFDDELIYIAWFDICTFITLFTGFGYLATTTDELLDGVVNAALSGVQILKNSGFDGAAMTAQFARGDYLGGFESFGAALIALGFQKRAGRKHQRQ